MTPFLLERIMIQPLSDRIFVKPIENSEYSTGGIYTDRAKTTFSQDGKYQTTVGEVVAVGLGKDNKKGVRRPPECKIGDIVVFSDSCSRRVEIEGEEYLVLREPSIAFFMEEAATVEHVYEAPKGSKAVEYAN